MPLLSLSVKSIHCLISKIFGKMPGTSLPQARSNNYLLTKRRRILPQCGSIKLLQKYKLFSKFANWLRFFNLFRTKKPRTRVPYLLFIEGLRTFLASNRLMTGMEHNDHMGNAHHPDFHTGMYCNS